VPRAILGFIYLTVVPGLVLVRLLKLDDLGLLKTIFFSVGLSVSFLMAFGLLINTFLPIIGINAPLSTISVSLSIILLVEVIAVFSLIRDTNKSQGKKMYIRRENKKEILWALAFLSLPILSVIGSYAANVYESNLVLLCMITLTSLLVVVVCIRQKLNSDVFLAFALCMIAVALLLHSSLASSYIYGGDIHMEYHLFRITQTASRWNPTVHSTDLGYNWLNAMLSVTILPTIYSNILGIDGTWVFKLAFPTIFSLVSLGLFLLYRKEFSSRISFVSVLFFMANSVFFTDVTIGNIRQMIAELFYVSIFLVLLDDRLQKTGKWILFAFFSVALVFSHYSTSYLFLFMIIGVGLYKAIVKKRYWKSGYSMIALFSTTMFSWYIYISNSGPFKGLLETYQWVSGNFMNQFLVVEARGSSVMEGIGLAGIPTFWHLVGRGFFYITEFLIIVGFLYLILKRKERVLGAEYFSIVLLNMAVLAACLIVPSFANTLNMIRFYHLVLFFLAPLLGVGGLGILRLVRQNLKPALGIALLMFVIVPFFLFQTGFVYEVTGEINYSIPLSKKRMGFTPYIEQSLVEEYDVYGARWVLGNVNYSRSPIYVSARDPISVRALNSYGMVYSNTIHEIYDEANVALNGIVFLGWINFTNETMNMTTEKYNTTGISLTVSFFNKAYCSGKCEIYESSFENP